VDRQQIRSNLA